MNGMFGLHILAIARNKCKITERVKINSNTKSICKVRFEEMRNKTLKPLKCCTNKDKDQRKHEDKWKMKIKRKIMMYETLN